MDNVPMLKPFLALLIGIVCAYYFKVPTIISLIFSIVSLLICIIGMTRRLVHIRWLTISSVSALLSLLFIGSFIYSYQNQDTLIEDDKYEYVATVDKILNQKENYTRCYLQIHSIKGKSLDQPYKIIANVYDGHVLPADTLYAQSYIKTLSSALNAGQFDLKKYYGYKYIYQTTSISSDRFIIHSYKGFHFQKFCYQAALWCKEVYLRFIPHRSAITMQALLLGVKSEISDEMMDVYMHTGVMHVLAVSGMHVGILYLGFMVLLRPIYRRWKFITIFPIIFVWLFSFMTGGGPAILRAAIMITFVDIGKKMDEEAHSVNMLFLSGFLMLMVQPYLVWDIGFQLSFAAMLGLFYLMDSLQNVLYVKNKWVRDYVWNPSVMSVSAQLATTPLTFFYFGNFPIYFLLTNLLILLPVTLALYTGVMLLVTSTFLPESFNFFLGKIIDYTVYYGFDALLEWMSKLPAAYSSQIYLSLWQVMSISIAVIFFAIWLKQLKNGKWLVYAVALCSVTVLGSFVRQVERKSQVHASVLQVSNTTTVAIDNFLWTPQANNIQVVKENGFSLNGYLREKGWKKWEYLPPDYVKCNDKFLVIGRQSLMYLNESLKSFDEHRPLEVDYLILGNDFYLNVDDLSRKIHFEKIVLDGSLSYSKYNLFKNILSKHQIPFWDTREQGSLEWTL